MQWVSQQNRLTSHLKMQDQFTSERAHTTSPRNSWSRSWSFCRDYKTSHKTLLNPLVDGEPISMSLLIYEKPSCSQSFVCHVQRRKKNKKNKLILLQHGPVTVTNNKLINNLICNLIKLDASLHLWRNIGKVCVNVINSEPVEQGRKDIRIVHMSHQNTKGTESGTSIYTLQKWWGYMVEITHCWWGEGTQKDSQKLLHLLKSVFYSQLLHPVWWWWI